jgi:hypothetical protein
MKTLIEKQIFSLSQLVAMGYQKEMLQRLIHSEDFSRFGYRVSDKPNAKAYIHKDKLDRYLERMMDDQGCVL